MATIVLVIGNGFDINLGLPSGYKDFVKSPEWKKLLSIKRMAKWKNKQNQSLLYQIKSHQYDNWFNIEEEINTFVREHTNPKEITRDNNKADFDDLKDSLTRYLQRITNEYTTNQSCLAYTLIKNLKESPRCHRHIFSFNYTDCLQLCGYNKYYYNPKACNILELTNIHGSLDNGIVLGCEAFMGDKINKDYSFMYKYNMLTKPNHIVQHLLDASEVVFFGHSINEMDFCYFRDYFKIISTTAGKDKNLTIICKDEKAEIDIKNNIRNQGIIVTDLYNNLKTLDFFHTDLINNNGVEVIKWNEFIDRIKRYGKESMGINVH